MDAGPRVSVVIPAYYSDGTIAACLGALRAQTFRRFETIVVNSSPETRTREVVAAQFPEVAFVQSQVRLLPHAARNRGVELARGPLLAFTDPDCVARSDWLDRLVQAQSEGHSIVGGSMGLRPGVSWFEKGVHLCKFHWILSGQVSGPRWILPTANVCCSREVWEAAGPFDGDRFSGDALFSWRAARAGYQPWFEPGAVVEHRHEETVRSFWRQRLDRGLDFARARVQHERWSKLRALGYLMVVPLLPLLVMARAARDALGAGWAAPFVSTIPVQFLGHLAWSLGEARAQMSVLFGGAQVRSVEA
jgi:GT2 family glycosyltransferase